MVSGANRTLTACDGTGQICRYEEQTANGAYINRAPFFVTGGWGAAIRASAPSRKKELAFALLSHISLTANVICPSVSALCPVSGGVME